LSPADYLSQMKLLPGQTAPDQFAAICRAHETARYHPGNRRMCLAVGVVDAGGVLVARGELHGMQQAQSLAAAMAALGYSERLFGPAEAMAGCDLVFVPAGTGTDAAAAEGTIQGMDAIEVVEAWLPDGSDSAFSALRF
jgi:hypothetical protein